MPRSRRSGRRPRSCSTTCCRRRWRRGFRAGEAVADSFSDLTVVFVDLAGFSAIAKRLSPGHLVKLLNAFFSAADRCAERHGLEKVKTIGDAYLAVAGGMASAEARQQGGDPVRARPDRRAGGAWRRRPASPLKARIGVHTGPAVGGVIGSTRLAYDYWGDTMNIASRLQGAAPLNGVAVSEATYFQTRTIQDYEEQIGDAQGDRRDPHLYRRIGEPRRRLIASHL